MAISVAEFKQAFAGKAQPDSVAQRDAQVAAALKRLNEAAVSAEDDDAGLRAVVKKLVERYERARSGKGDASRELDDILKQTDSVFGRIGKRIKARRAARSAIKEGAAGQGQAADSVGSAVRTKFVASTPLGQQICDAINAGGISIAIYFIGDPDSNNDREFKRQALVWAKNHGAYGLNGSKVAKDHAMPLSQDPGKLVTGLLTAVQRELGTTDAIPIANVALFSHGGSTSLKVDSQGEGGGEKWTTAGSKVMKEFAAAVKPSLTSGARIHLFACMAAIDRDAGKDKDDPTRKNSFAEALQEMTGAEVWGHEDSAHTTGNSRLVLVDDTDTDANAERYQIRDVFTRKFFVHVDKSLTETQMGYLDVKLKISKWIKDSLVSEAAKKLQKKGLSKEEKKKLSKEVDRHQVFIEEISMIGYDRVFDLLIAASPPGESTFRALFPEHDQFDKLVEGAAIVHAEFHRKMDEKVAAIATAKGSPDFPVLHKRS